MREWIRTTLVCAGLLWAVVGRGQEVTLTLAHFMSSQAAPHVEFLVPWAERVAAASGGRIRIELFPSMSLGGKPPELYRQVRDGAADIVLTVTGYTPGVFPRAEVFELPTVHHNSAEATSKALHDTLEWIEEDFTDVHVLALFTHTGNAIHSSGGCVETLEGFAGRKLRTPSRTGGWLISALGAEAVGMPLPSLPQALAKGTVEGALLPFEIIPPYKIHTLTDCSMSAWEDGRFGTLVFLFAMNRERYRALPADLRAVLDAHTGADLAAHVGALFDGNELAGKEAQRAIGSPVIELDAQSTAAMHEVGEQVVQRWIAEANRQGFDGAHLVSVARAAVRRHSR